MDEKAQKLISLNQTDNAKTGTYTNANEGITPYLHTPVNVLSIYIVFCQIGAKLLSTNRFHTHNTKMLNKFQQKCLQSEVLQPE